MRRAEDDSVAHPAVQALSLPRLPFVGMWPGLRFTMAFSDLRG